MMQVNGMFVFHLCDCEIHETDAFMAKLHRAE